jgi:hypothetical protein
MKTDIFANQNSDESGNRLRGVSDLIRRSWDKRPGLSGVSLWRNQTPRSVIGC